MTTQVKKTKLVIKRARLWRAVVTVLLSGVLIYMIMRNLHTVSQGVEVIRHAHASSLLAGLLLSILTFLIAAAIYTRLALHHILYTQTLLIELAGSFANRLLPAGLGGLGLHGLYLHKRKHTVAEATAIVSVNNLLGIGAHLSLLATACIVQPALLRTFTHHWPHLPWAALGVVLLVVFGALYLMSGLRRKLHSFGRNLLVSLERINLKRIAVAYVLALLLTASYTAVLYTTARAVGAELSVFQTFIVFSIGMLVGTATPTPGGLVGVEAGLYAGFIGYGVSSTTSAAAVLLYRLFTYWLPLTPGAIALLIVHRRKLV